MNFWLKVVSLAAVAGAVGGCVTQMQGMKVTNTVPQERALAYLKDLDAAFNIPSHTVTPQCDYSETGITGSNVQFVLVGATADRRNHVAFNQWRVDEIRSAKGMAGSFYTVVVKSQDGAICAPLRSKAGTPEAVVMPKIEETLTALVSLGVAYDPNRLGSSR